MILLVVYIVAYLMAGAPAIHSLEGWAVFGVVSIVAAVCGAISEVGSSVTVVNGPCDHEEEEDDIGF